ncbi:MAG: hypothetical protein MI864_01550 [Pseudomonadales bacterium]|nr:hypothetical protein [Pseudomonadales bacterium]
MDNLKIWSQVQKTDPECTKEFSGAGGYSGTSINATYMILQATKVFGPVGIGWGFDVVEDRVDEGAPLNLGVDNQPVINKKTHTIVLNLWYLLDGKKGEIKNIYGHTPFVYKNKYGIQSDDEAPKKSLTDAIKKALSMLGFSADVFMGQYDDVHYLNELRNEVAMEKATNKVEEKERQQKEKDDWFATQVRLINESTNMNMLEGLFKSAIRKLQIQNDQKRIIELTRSKDTKKEELSQSLQEAS